MKKVLLVTTVSGFVPQFEMNNVKILQQMDCEIHYAANFNMPAYGKDNSRLDGTGIIRHQIDFVRSPYNLKNKTVLKQLKELMRQEHFDLVHCHTPMGSVMARLAAHMTKTAPVIYTAHGFHFFRGAPFLNWLLYYPVERWLSHYADQLICINEEDFERAKHFKARYVDYIPGAGIDLDKLKKRNITDKDIKKNELNLPQGKLCFLSVGELIPRKNHESVIKAIARIQDDSFIYVICGQGELESHLKTLVKEYRLEKQVIFLGYRTDVAEIYQIADVFIFPSYQEGLAMAQLEAMAFGLPVVCSEIRGNSDLMDIVENQNRTAQWQLCSGGFLIQKANDVNAYLEVIRYILRNPEELMQFGQNNRIRVNEYSITVVERKMRDIYARLLK